jgi:hypothetical protein
MNPLYFLWNSPYKNSNPFLPASKPMILAYIYHLVKA